MAAMPHVIVSRCGHGSAKVVRTAAQTISAEIVRRVDAKAGAGAQALFFVRILRRVSGQEHGVGTRHQDVVRARAKRETTFARRASRTAAPRSIAASARRSSITLSATGARRSARGLAARAGIVRGTSWGNSAPGTAVRWLTTRATFGQRPS
jgi:hypothetical protein